MAKTGGVKVVRTVHGVPTAVTYPCNTLWYAVRLARRLRNSTWPYSGVSYMVCREG